MTTASFSTGGTYVLQLSANDSQYLSTSNVTITVCELYGHGGYKGTDFWLMFPQNYDDCVNCTSSSPYQFVPQLLISSDVANSGTVTIPGLGFSSNFTLAAGQGTYVDIPIAVAMLTVDGVENTGIHVTAQSEVTVVGLSYYQASSDGYLGLPTPTLGTNYIVMSWQDPYGNGLNGSEFGIVAPYDGTTVTITPTANAGGRVAGQPYTVVLNQGRTYQLQTSTPNVDLTGTAIASDKPIAVFSGMQDGFVPALAGIDYCCGNSFVEEMLSTDLWGQTFYTVPIAGHVKGDYFRILAAQNNTNVSIDGVPTATINQGEFYQTVLTTPSSIIASGPVMVAQYETSHWVEDPNLFDTSFNGDPSMFTVVPYQQYGGHYTVLNPDTGFPANYANLTVPTNAASSVTLDGAPITAAFTPIPGSTYSGAQVTVTPGVVHHFDGTAPFGLTIYGAAPYDAYSYPGGLIFDTARSGMTLNLTPTTLTQQTGTMLCWTASLLDVYGNPAGGIGVGFTIMGANASSQSVDSNSSGQAAYCYVGANSGTDTVSASIGSVTGTGTVTWVANSPNRAPIVYAGSNSAITLPSAANLLGVVSDDGLPIGGTLTTTWTMVSGAGSVTFGNAGQPVTTASFSAAGTYDLRLTANESQLNSYADVIVTVAAAPQIQPPVVNPGPNLTVQLPLLATLYGVVTDQGLPTGAQLAIQWAEVSGPSASAPVVFSSPTTGYTQATFVQPGTYVLSLTGDNSQSQTTADVTVTVIAQDQPPVISCTNGGSFATQLPNTTINLTCTVTENNPPQGATVTQLWSQVSGPAPVTFANPTQATTQATPFGTLSYTYDAASNLLTMKSSNSGGASDTYTYDQLNRLSTVTDSSGATTYAYDAVGNLQNFTYPNGVTHAYSYDTLNRLTQVGASKNAVGISNYAYTLGLAGNRLTVAELSGRTVNYGYDSLYRLTSEAVTSDPHAHDFTNGFTYDTVGNRQQWLVNGSVSNSYSYDADDRLGSDAYDANGNTIDSLGTPNVYDFENHMITHGAVAIVYDGDGNRVSETANGVTTNYLVDTVNPTGYAQVVDELQSGTVSRTYSYGSERISETQAINGTSATSFYGYDGHGSVRQLTNSTGAVTDTFDYDAFGNLINSTGSTPNNYLFAGEQYDLALNLYYNRARYLNTTTGRFWTPDQEGYDSDEEPLTLNKYLFAVGDPVDFSDPSGNEIDAVAALSISSTFDSLAVLNFAVTVKDASRQATTLSDRGLQFIAIEEGFVNHLYNDSAHHCTIGYGHLVSLAPCNKTQGGEYQNGITKPGAQDLLWQDSQNAIAGVNRLTSVGLAQNEFDAITDFVFNEGAGAYSGSDLRQTLNQGEYSLVPPLFFHFTLGGHKS